MAFRWNHRVVKKIYSDGYVEYGIRETHYNNNDGICSWTAEPVNVVAEDMDGLRWTLEMMLKCLDKEILVDDGKFDFATE